MRQTVDDRSFVTGRRPSRGGRTLLVATTGGHLSELVELEARLVGIEPDPVWLVPDSQQTRDLLAGRHVVAAPLIPPRSLCGLPATARLADSLLREHAIDCVVSTGAGLAVAAFLPARARGIACHYVESAARVTGPSLSGQLVQRLPGVQLYRQHAWPAPGRWKFVGSVFDGFQPRIRSELAPGPLRVVVTVGTMPFGFRRLVERLVRALPRHAEVFWQTGHTDTSGLDIEPRPWVSATELRTRMAAADVVVAHAGVGSALTALQQGARPILVPRRSGHAEHVDDHQVQIAGALAARDLALAVEAEDIDEATLTAVAGLRVRRRPGGAPPIPVAGSLRR